MQEKIGNAQIFVRIEDYKSVLSIIEHIKDKLAEAKSSLEKLQQIKREEDAEIEQWNSALNEIERRIENIDRSMLEPEGM